MRHKLKTALLCAAALTSAAGASAHASAGHEPAAPTHESVISAPHAEKEIAAKPETSRRGWLWAVLAGAAGLVGIGVKVLGPRRVAAMTGGAAKKVGRTAVNAASAAAKAVAGPFRSTLRFAGIFLAVTAFAFLGASLFDVQWILALAGGVFLGAMAMIAVIKIRSFFGQLAKREKFDSLA